MTKLLKDEHNGMKSRCERERERERYRASDELKVKSEIYGEQVNEQSGDYANSG